MEIKILLVEIILMTLNCGKGSGELLTTSNYYTTIDMSTEELQTTTDSLLTTENFENLTKSFSTTILENNNNSNKEVFKNIEQNKYPESCEGRKRLDSQPLQDEYSKIKKCCPYGENLQGDNGKYCDTQINNNSFNVSIVDVVLYENCIEDTEKEIILDYRVGNPCNVSFIYGIQNGDLLYVIQNGSLLIIDENRNESYQIENNYCLDIDYHTDELYAVVCANSIHSHIGQGQTVLFTIFMICSIPCLIIVGYLHFAIKELRTLHGLTLGCLSFSLAIGFLLHSIAQLADDTDHMKIGYAVQYFILEYFFWFFILCVNVAVTVWIFIPRYPILPRVVRYTRFGIYFATTMIIPLIFVLMTKYKGLDGMPSYFYQGWSESIRSSQRYFIPPVTVVLVISVILLATTYYGFEKYIEKVLETRIIDLEMYRETRKDFKCIVYLATIIITTWIFEIATFYLPGIGDYLAMMEIFNGLQGVFILMIFIVIRNRRHLIIRWWYDRGSLNTEVEMRNLNSKNSNKIQLTS